MAVLSHSNTVERTARPMNPKSSFISLFNNSARKKLNPISVFSDSLRSISSHWPELSFAQWFDSFLITPSISKKTTCIVSSVCYERTILIKRPTVANASVIVCEKKEGGILMAHCKDCRFYESKRCTERKGAANASNFTCYAFSPYSNRDPSGLKHCKDCRFYSGGKCLEKNVSTTPNSSLCYAASICK